MKSVNEVLGKVREQTDMVLLFSSVIGKDSILLTDACSKSFKTVVCVYMYIVQNMDYVNNYKNIFLTRYKNVRYLDLPHYAMAGFLKYGHLGLKEDRSQKLYTLADIDKIARERTGIQWSIYGSKKSDSMNRRLQLNTYPDLICDKTQKAYPIGDYTNKQVLSMIRALRLPKPLSYRREQSSGEDVDSGEYLWWLYENYPNDLKRTFNTLPATKMIFYDYQKRLEKQERTRITAE